MTAGVDHKLVLIETSGGIGQVAVADDTAIRARRQLDEARRHARDLAPAVKDLLREQDWRAADITAVLVSCGPGSYTGLRVGLMSAKAFAYATGCRLVGIETFAALAMQAAPGPAVEVIADAQQRKVYWQRFAVRQEGGMPNAVTRLQVLPLMEWLGRLTPQSRVIGPGVSLCRAHLPEHVEAAPESACHLSLESLWRLGLERLRRGEGDDLWTVEPIYARPSSAEEQWQSQGASKAP
jgi:tRNA threonylcarbamoyladenosine biosynthesis protein TsaB